jgi:hypothetical protein
MTPERWQMVRGILQSAMEMRLDERGAFLDRECASDPSLRKDVDEYLSIEGKLDTDFLESPAVQHVERPAPSHHPVTASWRQAHGLVLTRFRRCLDQVEWVRCIAPATHASIALLPSS